MASAASRTRSLSILLPGILVAATGVGAGDLLTASMAGAKAGTMLLWTAVAGAVLKWSLNEGIARWQLSTGTTMLEGWSRHLGGWIGWPFMIYFVIWSLMVGGALISACGVAGDSLIGEGTTESGRLVWGIAHSLLGLGFVWIGGFRFFEKIMAVCVALMVVGVLVTAVMLGFDGGEVLSGLAVPRLPEGSLGWALGVFGGVGGTVTLLSYGYWIRERGRRGEEGLRTSRIDLGVAYGVTAVFGIAMMLIGSRIDLSPDGGNVALQLAGQLHQVLGSTGETFFLIGFWGAVFSSLLGVWQSAPYIFADFFYTTRGIRPERIERTTAYRVWLVGMAIVPVVTLWLSVKQIQLAYAVMGALFMPMLALTLLVMNNRVDWIGARFRNGRIANGLLALTLAAFLWLAVRTVLKALA